MNEQWQKVNGKICCAAESWAILVLVGNNQIFLFSLLEYGSEERPKNEDVEARKLGASNLLPFCCTNHQSLSNRTLVAPLRAAHWPVLQFSPDSVFVCYVDVRITTE